MKTLRALLVATGLALTSAAYAETHIQAMCNVTGLASQCTFSNTGGDAGSGCATVVLTNKTTRQQLRSGTVCSGELQPASTGGAVPIQFIGNLALHCGAPNPGGIAANCDMQVEMSNVQVKGGGAGATAACGGFLFLLVLIASIFVYSDAKKRNNPNAVGWAVGTFFLFIIVFPWYLLTRDKHQPPPPGGGGGFGPPGGGYGPPGGGYPPQGGGFGPPGGGYPPQGGGFGPPGGGYPPQGGGYGPPGGGYPPQGGGYPPPGGGYNPPGR